MRWNWQQEALLKIIITTTFDYLRDLGAIGLRFSIDLESLERRMLDHLYEKKNVQFTREEKQFIHTAFYAGMEWVQNVAKASPHTRLTFRPGVVSHLTSFTPYTTQKQYLESISEL